MPDGLRDKMPDPMNLPAIRARVQAATPKGAAWTYSTQDGEEYWFAEDHYPIAGAGVTVVVGTNGEAVADMIAHAPSDLAALLTAYDTLHAAAREARKHVASQNEAEHMLDGFGGRVPRPSDDCLAAREAGR